MNPDGILTVQEWIFLGVFALLYFVVPALVVWASYCEKCINIDLRDLWTHNNRPDKLAVIILGTWWVHTCTVILWALREHASTADFATYMGWAIPIIAKMFFSSRSDAHEFTNGKDSAAAPIPEEKKP